MNFGQWLKVISINIPTHPNQYSSPSSWFKIGLDPHYLSL